MKKTIFYKLTFTERGNMERLHGIYTNTATVRVNFKVNEGLKKEFDEKCRLNNTTPSDMHRALMEKYLRQGSW